MQDLEGDVRASKVKRARVVGGVEDEFRNLCVARASKGGSEVYGATRHRRGIPDAVEAIACKAQRRQCIVAWEAAGLGPSQRPVCQWHSAAAAAALKHDEAA